jgi:hypothetical protein
MERTPEPVSDMLLPLQLLARCGADNAQLLRQDATRPCPIPVHDPLLCLCQQSQRRAGQGCKLSRQRSVGACTLVAGRSETDSSGRVRLPSDCRTIGNFETRFEYVCVWVRTRFAISQAGVQPKKHSRITNSQRRRMDSHHCGWAVLFVESNCKMVCLAIDVARGATETATLAKALDMSNGSETVRIALAPAQCLFLDMSFCIGYNN